MMSNKTYDTLKVIALLVLPIGTLISAFCNIWNIPYGDQIMQTFAALDVFCGALVTIAKAQYDKLQQ
jgi:N6-adenosine-specific RNA methylase IME4